MRKHGLGLSSAQSMRALKLVAEALGFKDPDEMYVHIGTGKEKAQHVTNRLLKILVECDEDYPCGTPIAIIGEPGEDISGLV